MAGFLGKLPRGVMTLVREAGRHVLRRPVMGIAMAAHTADGRWLLIRRADTGTWALPGGTVEWGETLRTSLARELEEEGGVVAPRFERVTGVYSEPDRDPRFHAVTVCVRCAIEPPVKPPVNPAEILEARLFAEADLPAELALGMRDMLDAAIAGGDCVFE
ncbi:MAG: NUDIX hydrolase [Myxococcales bacterium]|nr:NUDIX hydrolase [Myxococcales bacterium]